MGTVSVTDSLSLSDVITPYNLAINLPTDGITLSDSVSPLVTISLLFNDEITLIDSVIYTLFSPFVRVAGDAINLADGITFTGTGVISEGDTLSLSDGYVISPSIIESDTFTFSDTIGISIPTGESDSYTLSDTVGLTLSSSTQSLTVTAVDSIFLLDSDSLTGPQFAKVGDLILFQDGQAVSLNSTLNSYLRRYLNDLPTPTS